MLATSKYLLRFQDPNHVRSRSILKCRTVIFVSLSFEWYWRRAEARNVSRLNKKKIHRQTEKTNTRATTENKKKRGKKEINQTQWKRLEA